MPTPSEQFAALRAAYDENASYLEDGSAAKARAFITACRRVLMHLPKRVNAGGGGGEEVEMEVRVLQDQIADAQAFLTQSNLASAPKRHISLENFRD